MGSSTLLNRFLLAVMVVELLLLVADVPEKAEAMDKKSLKEEAARLKAENKDLKGQTAAKQEDTSRVQAENKGIEAGNAEMRKQIDEAKKKLGYS